MARKLWLVGLVVMGLAAPASAQAPAAEQTVTAQQPYATEVGDLNGDDVTDVVTNDRVITYNELGLAGDQFHRLTARSGATGATLWVHDEFTSNVAVHPVQMPDGAGVVIEGHTGLHRLDLLGDCWSSMPFTGCLSSPTALGAEDTHLTALTGEGTPRWTRSFDYAVRAGTSVAHAGLSADASGGAHQAVVPLQGAEDRLAIVVRDGPSVQGGGGSAAGRAAQIQLLDPATGEDTAANHAIGTLGEVHWYPWPGLTADGDGVLLISGGHADAHTITGERLWSADLDLRPGEYLYPMGDVDGDGRGDQALSGTRYSSHPAERSLVISATGAVLAARANLPWVFPAGNVDGQPGDEVVFSDSSRVGGDAPAGSVNVLTEVVDGTGTTIRHGAAVTGGEGTLHGFTGMPGHNDLDGDGFGDVVRMRVSDGAIAGADLIGTNPTTLIPLRGAGDASGWAGRRSSVLGPDMLVTIEGRAGRLVATGTGSGEGWVTDLGVGYDADAPISSLNDVDRLGPEDEVEGYLVNWAVGDTSGTALLDLDGALRWTTAG